LILDIRVVLASKQCCGAAGVNRGDSTSDKTATLMGSAGNS
jgi:hypothetical protein